MKPIIGIIGRKCQDKFENEVIKINESLRQAIIKAGGIPLGIIPTSLKLEINKEEYVNILKKCDGLLLPGGDTIDKYDEISCEYAINNDIPLLGICLGMQVIGSRNYFQTNNSNHTIKNNTIINHNKNEKYVHKVIIVNGKLKKIFNKEIKVNSSHNYHIEKTNDIITAISEDGLIEGIEIANKKFIMGVQWHPEKMIDYDNKQLELFRLFIKECSK